MRYRDASRRSRCRGRLPSSGCSAAAAVAILAIAWSASAQRPEISDGVVSASHLRVGMRGVRLALGDVRFGDDAAWLHIGRLDGRRTARPRRAVIVRVFPVSGSPAMVHEPCKAGIHVVGDTAAPW
jgi:hypothetical protein